MADERGGRRWRGAIAVTSGAVLTAGLGGCGTGGGDPDPGTTPSGSAAAAVANAAMSPGTSPTPTAQWPWAGGARLDVPAFREAVGRPGTVVLDVRTPQEFAVGHLPGAILADVSSPEFATKVDELDRSRRYAVYCRSGNRSQIALDALRRSGFSQVVELAGGIVAWTAAGGRTTSEH